MAATYEVKVDLNGDGDFSDANEDLSAYWRSMAWHLGATRSSADVARDTTLRVVLRNVDKRFSPEDAASIGLAPNQKIRVQSTHANEAGPLLGQPGIGDGGICPLFDSAHVDCYSVALASAFDGDAGTLIVWFKVSASGVWTDGSWRRAVFFGADGNNFVSLVKPGASNEFRFLYTAGGTAETVTKSSVSDTDWVMAAITWDATADEVKAYWNGAQEGSTQTGLGTYAGSLGSTLATIGANSTGGGEAWDGWLDHVALWSEALTADELDALYGGRFAQTAAIRATRPHKLVGHWALSEEVGSSAEDSKLLMSPYRGGRGIAHGETATYFDASTSVVDIYSSGFNTDFDGSEGSVSFWMRIDSDAWTDGVRRRAFQLFADAQNTIWLYKHTTSNQLVWLYEAGNVLEYGVVATSDTDWLHCTTTWSATDDEAIFYLNGAQQGAAQTGLGTWAGNLSAAATVIGAGNTSASEPWRGQIAHFTVWNTPLSGAQVLALYNAQSDYATQVLATEPSSIVGHYKLDEAEGAATASDSSSAGNDGTYKPNTAQLTAYDGTYSTANRTRTHFVGRIDPDGIEVEPGVKGPRETVVRASGSLKELMDEEVTVEVQEAKTTSEVIEAILKAGGIYPAGLSDRWLLGVTGHAELGQTTYLGGIEDYTDLDAGVKTFNYVGDNWQRGTSLYRALRDVVQAHRGFSYEDREGQLVFKTHQYWHKDMLHGVNATLDDGDVLRDKMRYAYGGRLMNDMRVSIRPREVGSSTEVLGALTSTPRVKGGESETVTLRYGDDTDNRIGGKDVVAPVRNTDYTANSERDGSGTDWTTFVSVSVQAFGTQAEITFVNSAGVDVYILNPAGTGAGAQVRGTKITDFGQEDVTYEDAASIVSYGRQKDRLNLRLLDDLEFAENLARWEVQTRKDPQGVVEAITVAANRNETLLTHALGLTIGDRIAYSEGQTGVDGEYFIVGERHRVDGKNRHEVTWVTRPAPLGNVWVLGVDGYSEIGQTTYLAL